MQAQIRTSEEVRDWFYRHGVSVADWARAHGYSATIVAAVLAGRSKGSRGQGHRISVALGLKPAVESIEPSPLDARVSSAASRDQTIKPEPQRSEHSKGAYL
jgi:gp16 family phage-associated protein